MNLKNNRIWLRIVGIYLRSLKAQGKKDAKPAVKALRSLIKVNRQSWGISGGFPAKRTGKRVARRHIEARTKFQGAAKAKDILNPYSDKAFMKLRLWSPIFNYISTPKGRGYRTLPFQEIGLQHINLSMMLRKVDKKARRQIDPILAKYVGENMKKEWKAKYRLSEISTITFE